MDKKSKILLSFVALAIIISVGLTFYRYVVLQDYQIIAEISCDPATDDCFVRTEEDESTSTYRLLSRNAANIPLCDPETNENCRALLCEPNERDCEITSCSEEDLPEGESCSR